MNITNNNKIPAPIYRAICQNWYSGAGADHFCSVTELLKPVKLLVLERRYKNMLEEEASDLIWSLMGSAMHKVLEASEHETSLNEERLFCQVNGKTISGGVDLYEEGIISDFKFTSVWSYIYGNRRKEWAQQLNLYAYLYMNAGFDVNKLQVIAVFRDWSKLKARIQHDYPKQVMIIPIKLWDMSRIEQFIKERLFQLKIALKLPDDAIKECSQRERWQDDDMYAIMKKGNIRATKLCKSQKQAEAYLKSNKDKDKLSINIRKSIPKRCEDYCRVNKYCHFYRKQHPELFQEAI
ncbi:MAG: hypothetical protein HQ534_04480 [Armatimonadetes bacterium]|nr:hypothetical protein [Armatimonadota bacterium]